MERAPGIETYADYQGHPLLYQLHVPENATGPVPVAFYFHGFGGDKDSISTTATMGDVLKQDIAVVHFDVTPVRRDLENPQNKKVDTSMLTPSYYVTMANQAIKHTRLNHGTGPDRLVDMDKSFIIGSSFGGYSGLWLTAHMNGLQKRIVEDPEPVQGILLQSPVLEPLRPFWLMLKLFGRSWREKGFRNQKIAGHPQMLCHELREECEKLNIYRDVAPHITVPVTTIYGGLDTYVPRDTIQKLHKALPKDAAHTFYEIPKAGHIFQDRSYEVALRKLTVPQLRSRLNPAPQTEDKDLLMLHCIEQDFKNATKIGDVIDLSKTFMLNQLTLLNEKAKIIPLRNEKEDPGCDGLQLAMG